MKSIYLLLITFIIMKTVYASSDIELSKEPGYFSSIKKDNEKLRKMRFETIDDLNTISCVLNNEYDRVKRYPNKTELIRALNLSTDNYVIDDELNILDSFGLPLIFEVISEQEYIFYSKSVYHINKKETVYFKIRLFSGKDTREPVYPIVCKRK